MKRLAWIFLAVVWAMAVLDLIYCLIGVFFWHDEFPATGVIWSACAWAFICAQDVCLDLMKDNKP